VPCIPQSLHLGIWSTTPIAPQSRSQVENTERIRLMKLRNDRDHKGRQEPPRTCSRIFFSYYSLLTTNALSSRSLDINDTHHLSLIQSQTTRLIMQFLTFLGVCVATAMAAQVTIHNHCPTPIWLKPDSAGATGSVSFPFFILGHQYHHFKNIPLF
jgi:hypothetical protein